MKSLRTIVTGLAVTGLLAAGAAPAVADGRNSRDGRGHEGERIKVILVEKHARSGHKKVVEEKTVDLKEAARYADRKCEDGHYWKFYRTAKWVEEKDRKWVEVCSYDHRHNKHKDYYVYFSDVDAKKHDHHGRR
ncbi:hypothetical protein AUQ48_13995 [Kocuria flava]|uniref:Uncharacterized protein n=1 Tax=Kocuria flava TaxID=446860 RepID=A0A2N4T4G4_9MICC|nr:hypothetical protein [Kocuria flava]PLC13120.1 hypothetical protein AUQ48_13995 [Kocuria flava]